ncbi:MAG: glycosyltransferase family 4 protein [Rhodospirillales bacterium]|nr:glycosyltransferase family 4 protein [Rhodospirillales bacterium]
MAFASQLLCQKIKERLGPAPAKFLLMTKSGLAERVDDVSHGQAPREFFYNFFDLVEKGYDARIMNTSAPYTGVDGYLARLRERVWSRLSGISQRHHYLNVVSGAWQNADVIVSYTDHFSLTLGDYFKSHTNRPKTVGVFHGLCDFSSHLTPIGSAYADRYIRSCLKGLDALCFLGPGDLNEARRRYDLLDKHSSQMTFGVDTDFWRPPLPGELSQTANERHQLLSVGSDPNRDYETLLNADLNADLNIITRLPITELARGKPNVTITQGTFWDTQLTDIGLRQLYWDADAIIIPLRDVYQPTGQSVTLQAMACGKPVIFSNIKGNWSPQLLINGQNCLLVPPGSPIALEQAVKRLKDSPSLSAQIGQRARQSVEDHFTLSHMNESLMSVINRIHR